MKELTKLPFLVVAIAGILIMGFIVVLGVVWFGGSVADSVSPHNIKYEVAGIVPGEGLVDVTIQNENGDTSQFSGVPIGWTYEFEAQPGDFVYVSAQNKQDDGIIIVSIYVDDVVRESNKSEGAYVIAAASDTV
ncbi:MAG: hypothetical protein SVK08_00710 [Halobacteriota archaeon]|nr:hypothetical protein [Halobacteriota archaeon]